MLYYTAFSISINYFQTGSFLSVFERTLNHPVRIAEIFMYCSCEVVATNDLDLEGTLAKINLLRTEICASSILMFHKGGILRLLECRPVLSPR